MADLAKRQPTAIERALSGTPDKSRTRQNFQYALYATQEQPKLELAAGTFATLVAVVIGYLLGSGGLMSAATGLVTGVGTFLIIIGFIFCWHWVHAPGAFRDYWEAKAKELPDTAAQTLKKKFLAERLRDLLREVGEADLVATPNTTDDMMIAAEKMGRYARQRRRALDFLRAHFPEKVERFETDGNRVLEELFAASLSDHEEPEISPAPYPKLQIEITRTTFDFTDDKRIGTGNHSAFPNDECYVTLFLKINPRPVPAAIKTFKLTLRVKEDEFESFAESQVFNYRFVDLDGTEAGNGSNNQNLNQRTPLLIDDRPIQGSLQFIFEKLNYLELLIDNTDLEGSPFTLLLTDTDGERHTAEGILTGDGNRYVNP